MTTKNDRQKTAIHRIGITMARITALAVMAGVFSSCATSYESMSPSRVERSIVSQATIGGVALGALAGYALNHNKSDRQKVTGTLAGAAAGGAVGYWIGQKQVENVRGQRRETTRLAKMVSAARSYNNDVAAYNRRLITRIGAIKKMSSGKERAAIARSTRVAAEKSIRGVESTITTRESALKTIPSNQSYELKKTISSLESEKSKLIAAKRRLMGLEAVNS